MPMRDNFLAAKKVAIALQALIASALSPRLPRPRRLLGDGARDPAGRAAGGLLGLRLRHEPAARARARAARCSPTRAGSKQIIVITDGEPTAHVVEDGEVFFNYPPVPETIEATLHEVVRCTRERIVINTFVLDETGGLRGFVQQMTRDEPGPGLLHHARARSATTCSSTSSSTAGRRRACGRRQRPAAPRRVPELLVRCGRFVRSNGAPCARGRGRGHHDDNGVIPPVCAADVAQGGEAVDFQALSAGGDQAGSRGRTAWASTRSCSFPSVARRRGRRRRSAAAASCARTASSSRSRTARSSGSGAA